MRQKIKLCILACLFPLAVGALAAWLIKGYMGGYNQPFLTPPNWLFPIVWTILYILMGISSAIVFDGYHRERERALLWYVLQLAVNFFWCLLFFRLRVYLWALIVLSILIVLVTAMLLDFYKISYLAGLLQVPYLYWCFFAFYLNAGVYLLN